MPEEEHEVETPCDHDNPSSHYVWSSCGMESDDCGESEHGDNDWSTKESTATDSHTEDEIDDNTSNHVKQMKLVAAHRQSLKVQKDASAFKSRLD